MSRHSPGCELPAQQVGVLVESNGRVKVKHWCKPCGATWLEAAFDPEEALAKYGLQHIEDDDA